MTEEDLRTRIKFIVDRLSFRIGDLTLMYEHKQVDPDDFFTEVYSTKSDFVESIVSLVREYGGQSASEEEVDVRELIEAKIREVYPTKRVSINRQFGGDRG